MLDFIFEHIPILKQLPYFSSSRVFGTNPGFETITRIHINVNFQTFTHLRNKTRFFDKTKRKIKTYCSFNNLITIKAVRNQIINIVLFLQ